MKVNIFLAYNHKEEIKSLFMEYSNMLLENEPSFQEYLGIQNFDDEIENLEKKYGLPDGRLYIAYIDESPVGCIALRKIDKENCEMKRLYVRPEFRGNKIGNLLVDRIIYDGKALGYKYMLLDTLPFLDKAIEIYRKLGFYEIPAYNDSPIPSTVFMKLDL